MSTARPPLSSSGNSASEKLFFTGEGAFREVVRFLKADGTVPAEILLGDIGQGNAISIDKDTPVRVIKRLEGGAEVTITSGALAGEVGFMLIRDLPKEPPGEESHNLEI
jgi:hypothetical protein